MGDASSQKHKAAEKHLILLAQANPNRILVGRDTMDRSVLFWSAIENRKTLVEYVLERTFEDKVSKE